METEKKDSLAQKIKTWFSLLWSGYVTEVQDRVFMSWKRVIKFLGISIVPIIYGVVCLVAFWNPIAGIGRAPVAIFNQDQNVILVESFDTTSGFVVGALVNPEKESTWWEDDATIFPNLDGEDDNSVENLTRIIATLKETDYYVNNGILFRYDKATTHLRVVSMWEVMKSMMLPKTDETIRDEDYTFKTAVISQGMALTNIHYVSDPKEISHQWQGSKYYVQVKLEKNYTANLFGWLGSVIGNEKGIVATPYAYDSKFKVPMTPGEWKDRLTQMQVWTTFERNFIFGYYMQTFSTFASGLIFQAIPSAFTNLILGDFVSGLSIKGETLNWANDAILDWIKPRESYVILRSGDTNVEKFNEKNLRSYSLFGNVDQTGEIIKEGEVGGKFISSIKELQAIKKLGIIEIIESILGPMNPVVRAIIDEAFKLLDQIKDEQLEPLNSFVYKGITGQLDPDKDIDLNNPIHLIVLQFLKKLGFSTNPEELIKQIKIFDPTELVNPIMTQKTFETDFSNFMAKNPEVFLGATSLKELPSIVAAKIIAAKTGNISTNDFFGFKLQGNENGLYGIGLGQFFLVIGLWIGVLMHTFVFDRAKRKSKLTPSTWYLSKTMLMLTVVIVQATIEVWVAYLAGWHMIGIEATLFMWLWLLASGIMFVFIIQGLWFVVKDETIGKFMAVIVMVLSLAAGGGTFPALAQFKFFTIMGYLVPFTYVLKGLGAIVYGVSILGTTANTTAVIGQAFGVFFIYIVIFGALGLFVGAKNRFKEMDYGSHYGRCVALAMIALKRNPDKIGFREIKKIDKKGKNKYKYHWDKLPPGLDLELYLKVRVMFPFEGRFKWWERKQHDPVQKPNFSDEDIMTRNE